MHTYTHRVNYYETDRMGITHHSNYIRWMEEARCEYLASLGFGIRQLEDEGIISPVVDVACRYIATTTFDDNIAITISIREYTGVRLTLGYTMINATTGVKVCEASSSHCFLDAGHRPAMIRKLKPELDAILKTALTAPVTN